MADTSSCASSAASTPLMSSKPLATDTPLIIRLPPSAPVMMTASPPSPRWRAGESSQQDNEDDFRPPGLSCYSGTHTNARGGTAPNQSRRPLAAVGIQNEDVGAGAALRDQRTLSRGADSRSGKAVTANKSRGSRVKPYDPTGAPPPLREAIYTASRLKLGPKAERELGASTHQLEDTLSDHRSPSSTTTVLDGRPSNIKVVGGTGVGDPDLVPIKPSAPFSPRVPAHALYPVPDPSNVPPLPHPLEATRACGDPNPARAWISIPASIPVQAVVPDPPAARSYPTSYPHLPQWQRLDSLRTDYASNAYAAKTSSLEIHARDYRAGILLLSLLDVLRDRQKLINERMMDMQRMTWNVMEMKEMGCSWNEMGITEAHTSANEFFKSIWGCEFEDVTFGEDGSISLDAVKNWLELKEDGASGANLPVGHIPSYPDGVHLPSLERLIAIPMRRADEKIGEFDIQKMGRAFAEAPFDVLKGLVRGVDGSRYAPLEV